MEIMRIVLELWLAAIVYCVGHFMVAKYLRKIGIGVADIEAPRNRDVEPPSKQESTWHLAHIRQDVSSIYGALCVISGLLAAILVVLIIR